MARVASGIGDEYSGIHDVVGIESFFECAEGVESGFAEIVVEVIFADATDAVVMGDPAAEGGGRF
jgi:urease gamma subunit